MLVEVPFHLVVGLGAAFGIAVGLAVLGRRRAARERVRTRELHELEERISQRVAALTQKADAGAGDTAAAASPTPIEIGMVEQGLSTPPPVPVDATSPIEPEPAEDAVPIAASVPFEPTARQSASVRRGRPRIVAGEGRPRQRGLLRNTLAAFGVIVLLVLLGSQVLPALNRQAGAVPVPTPTEVSGVVSSGSSPSPVPTQAPDVTFEPPATPVPPTLVYMVRAGDTMWRIALNFKVTLQELIAANPQISDPNKIYAGDRLTIPTPNSSPNQSATASAVP